MFRRTILLCLFLLGTLLSKAQVNTDHMMKVGRNALYYSDYVLSIQYFNQVVNAKPYLHEPYFFRGLAKFYLDDFIGTENDCTEAIRRNPFVVDCYQLRGLARVNQAKYAEAIDDYRQALYHAPKNEGLWHNLALCYANLKKYEAAIGVLDTIVDIIPSYAPALNMRAQVHIQQEDTISALNDLEASLKINKYDSEVYATRALVYLQQERYEDAEEDLTYAIHLSPKSNYYINRALTRYYRQELRGAMSDYDQALDLEPNNVLGHYNRGLLRAQVGDDNRAIEDFNVVLENEPDNMMALFNRAILLQNTGDIRKAIADYTKVIEHYPDFWTGLHKRAECYRMLGMNKEAELDEFRVYKAQMDKRYGSVTKKRDNKTRKRSDDADMDKYNQLVVADEQEFEHQYDNDYRGKVQNRRVSEGFMDMYELSFENNNNKIGTYIAYDRQVDSLNNINRKDRVIHIIATHKTLDETKSKAYFTYIDTLSSDINNHALLKRAIAYTAVQDYESAVSDLTQYLSVDSTSAIAYWVRGVCRSKLNKFDASLGANVGMKTVNVISDFTEGIKCNPSNAYLYYNRANVYVQRKDYESAISDYTKAIEIDSNLPEAYYNRGMAYIHTGKKAEGIADLSKAGELGLYTAYSVLKKYNK